MSKIIPKLNLNKTPQMVDNYSMIFAKNVKLLKDSTLGQDDSYSLLGQNVEEALRDYIIIDTISYNTKFYIFAYKQPVDVITESAIFEYNEVTKEINKINCNWNYSGGKIDGCVTINLRNEILLTIGEYYENNVTKLIPIKTINLSTCTSYDDETIYTQTPKIPLLNLELAGTYDCVIPPGVYQFFVRYEIKKDYFSKWLPCSVELFTATPNAVDTAQGALRFINKNEDSNSSFIFTPSFTDNLEYNYVSYQLGFLLSTNETVVARSWKKFKFDTNIIYFDYDKDYIEELDVKDILSDIVGYYNIKNITYFKNKLYLSNYIESNINPDLQSEADKWRIDTVLDVSSGGESTKKYYYKDDETVSLAIEEQSVQSWHLPIVYGDMSGSSVQYTEVISNSNHDYVGAIFNLNTASIYNVLFSRRNQSFNHAFFTGDINNDDNIFCKNVNKDYCTITIEDIVTVDNYTPQAGHRAIGTGRSNDLDTAERLALKSIATNFNTGYKHYYPQELETGCYTKESGQYYPDTFVKLGFDIDPNNQVYDDHPEFHPKDRSPVNDKIHLTASVNVRDGSYDLSHTISNIGQRNYDAIAFSNTQNVWRHNNNSFEEAEIDVDSTPTNVITDVLKSIKAIVVSAKIDGNDDVDYTYNNSDIITKFIAEIYNYSPGHLQTENRIIGDGRFAGQTEQSWADTDFSFISVPIEIHYPVLTHTLESGIYYATATEWIKKVIYKVKITTNKISTRSAIQDLSNTTLIPFQKYKFFIHYVTKYGEITNGYQIDTDHYQDGFYYNLRKNIIDEYAGTKGYFDEDDVIPLIYPKFYKNFEQNIPDKLKDYQGYFFSYAKTKGTFYALTNGQLINNSNDYVFDCIDADVLNITLKDNITVYCLNTDNILNYGLEGLKTYTGTYVYSGDYNKAYLSLFGSSGKLLIQNVDTGDEKCFFFIRINNENNSEYLQLTRCTQYYSIQDTENRYYEDYEQVIHNDKIQAYNPETLNLGGYIIKVSKPNNTTLDYFYSAGKKYEKNPDASDRWLKLDVDETVIEVGDYSNNFDKIYSNHNVNFLYLSEGITSITPKIRDYTNSNSNSGTQVLTMLESLTLSSIYTFDKTYKDYTRKQFNVYSKDNIITFDNTVRASELEIDEGKTYIYRFNIDDEYNVPTNKGKIVNLLGIGDYVIVHTENSIFKFTGKVRFSQQDNSVQVIESDIFDTGITEITGSDYGYAGLVKKEHAFVCQFGYIYWDAEANTIFYYNGDQEPSPISDPIFKLLNLDTIQNITFCADYDNDRFFINIKYTNPNIKSPVVLSYNFKAKAFISLHDFDFDKAFNTKSHYYLIKTINNNNKIYKVDKTAQYYPQELLFTDKLYPQKYTISKQYSIVDIIINENYENIKTLNYIEWICKKIIHTFIASQNKNVETDRLSEEDVIEKYAGDYIMIYTDSTKTALLDITQANEAFRKALYKKEVEQESEEEVNINNEIIYQEVNEENRDYNHSPVISEMYKLPRYNLGKWTLNYFRNVLDTTDITYSQSPADQQSLIYGKYFVIRLIFDKGNNFKLENIDINYKW